MVAVAIAAGARTSLAGLALLALAGTAGAQQASWVMGPAAKQGLQELWALSLTTRREQVACLGGVIGSDIVQVTRILQLDEYSDSLTASAQLSLTRCAPPEWIGTVHSHVRSTDDTMPAGRFSAGDRMVMSAWTARWGGQGAFCILYSAQNAHCEVYPPRRSSMERDST